MDEIFNILKEELSASVFVDLFRDEKIPSFMVSKIFKKHIDNGFDIDII